MRRTVHSESSDFFGGVLEVAFKSAQADRNSEVRVAARRVIRVFVVMGGKVTTAKMPMARAKGQFFPCRKSIFFRAE